MRIGTPGNVDNVGACHLVRAETAGVSIVADLGDVALNVCGELIQEGFNVVPVNRRAAVTAERPADRLDLI